MLDTVDIWTAVCVFEQWALRTDRAVWELKKWSVRDREHFYQSDSAYPNFTNFKLIDNNDVTQSPTLRVLRPLFQIASLCFGSLAYLNTRQLT